MPKVIAYNHKEIEKKWQGEWEKRGIYSPQDMLSASNNFYNLWMFPYPSGEGLHAGHAFASSGSDIYGRFMRMQGKTVFQPIGYDSFGIHTENFALKIGEHPTRLLTRTTRHYQEQLKSMGHGYDWTRTVTTSDIDYYVWTQWLFTKLFKAGLAYKTKAQVNWCPSCKTVLADEQVISGLCERCKTEVTKKELEQWFFRIKDYADRLLANLEKIDWSKRVKLAQANWIGKSKGAKIRFQVKGSQGKYLEVFTTRPDTLNGATFIVISPDSPQAFELTTQENRDEVSKYIQMLQKRPATDVSREKTGVFSGSYAINPLSGKEIPIWVSEYVLATYGMGVIMGVPEHDARDREFAEKFGIEIAREAPDSSLWERVEKEGWGGKFTNYHLRDWLISRQRYWGPPIPMIFCQSCKQNKKSYFTKNKPSLRADQSDWDHLGWYPVEEGSLPVELPELEDYQPTGTGASPLAQVASFVKVKCPGCGGEAVRETDVSDTFLDSSWYFLRYPSLSSKTEKEAAFDPEITKKWLPVDFYFGGAEHSVLHLMYARFMTMVLYDLKKIHFEEPFPKFFAHGLMIKEGAKMSKSRGNVVNPDAYIEKFGADTLRIYLVFIGPMDQSPDFRDTGMEGMKKFVERIWRLFVEHKEQELSPKDEQEIVFKMHQTIKKVTEDIQIYHYNTAISSLMELTNLLYSKLKSSKKAGSRVWSEALSNLIKMLAPFAPHLAEEIWVNALNQKFSVHLSQWPMYKPEFVKEEEVTLVVQVDARLRGQLRLNEAQSHNQKEVEEIAKKDSKVAAWLEGKKVKKTIFVSGKLINFVLEH